ncbi:MAG: hypothetical protein GX351_11905 [Peptococcaceae bacterium]|nr:hypothetical protein [Peptococcaceae bacterium]
MFTYTIDYLESFFISIFLYLFFSKRKGCVTIKHHIRSILSFLFVAVLVIGIINPQVVFSKQITPAETKNVPERAELNLKQEDKDISDSNNITNSEATKDQAGTSPPKETKRITASGQNSTGSGLNPYYWRINT